MSFKNFMTGSAGVLLLLGVVFFVQENVSKQGDERTVSPMPEEEEATRPAERSEVEERPAAAVEDLSIAVFAQKDFEGKEFTVGKVLEQNSAYTRYYITYRSDGLKISGIMNVPTSSQGPGPFPVLFLNHGYINPGIYTNGRGLKREQDYLARQGYVVVHSDYRNHADSDRDPSTEQNFRFGYAADVINGIGALRAANLSYVDSERIGMLGHSMGGGVAYLIAVAKPELVDAFVLFAPVSAEAWENFEKYTRNRRETAEEILATYSTPADNARFWNGISPIHDFQNITAPLLIQHGTMDDSTPLVWSEKSLAALVAAGKDAHMDIYPGEPHEFTAAWPTVMRRTTAFFDEQVKRLK